MDKGDLVQYGKMRGGPSRVQSSGGLGKRSHQQINNGKNKKRNFSSDSVAKPFRDVETLYRILCPVKNIGSVLGKGGTIVNALRDETHAKIRVADVIPGADERVIIIFDYVSPEQGKQDGNKDPNKADDTDSESLDMHPLCPAHDALLKIHDRIVADELQQGNRELENDETADSVTVRLLVPSNQVGCLLGKGGSVIQNLRSDTGANIRVLPAEHLPPCAMRSDELVQISGSPNVVKKAIYDISSLLYHHPRKENPPLDDVIAASTQRTSLPSASIDPSIGHGNPMWSHQKSDSYITPPAPWSRSYGHEPLEYISGSFRRDRVGHESEVPEEFLMKLVCRAERIKGIIGKAGAHVRQLEQQTGARIQVENTSDSEIRAIYITSKAAPWDPVCPTIEAILLLQGRASEISEKGTITTKILVHSSKVGCLLGEGGHIITEMRRRTRADIRVYSKDDKPKYVSANEELVQISGTPGVSRDALLEVASRLRDRAFPSGNAVTSHLPIGSFDGHASSDSFPRREPSSTMRMAPTFGDYDYMNLKGNGMNQDGREHPLPPVPISTGYREYNSSLEYGSYGSYGSYGIPKNTVPSVIGGAGNNYSDFRQISGTRVKLNDSLSGASECVADIHGSSDHVNAAQNVMQSYRTPGVQNPYSDIHGSSDHVNAAQNVMQSYRTPGVQNPYPNQFARPY